MQQRPDAKVQAAHILLQIPWLQSCKQIDGVGQPVGVEARGHILSRSFDDCRIGEVVGERLESRDHLLHVFGLQLSDPVLPLNS